MIENTFQLRRPDDKHIHAHTMKKKKKNKNECILWTAHSAPGKPPWRQNWDSHGFTSYAIFNFLNTRLRLVSL